MTPAAYVRVILSEHRRRGTPFEEAWLSALRSLPKGVGPEAKAQIKEWKVQIAWAKQDFRAAYLGLEPPHVVPVQVLRELAAAFAADDEELQFV